ncbi:hypothetical protein, partial [Streptomyces stelliscabiei]|uniref:hypothetical protein n=1 Tax=Streptomyces stelliscabiei TaxID=146820 RepID=UPI001ABF7E51
MDMDAITASGGKYRFRLNTRMLLEMPYQEWANDTAGPASGHRSVGKALDQSAVTALSSPRGGCGRAPETFGEACSGARRTLS